VRASVVGLGERAGKVSSGASKVAGGAAEVLVMRRKWLVEG